MLVDSLISLAQRTSVERLFLACHGDHEQFYRRSGFSTLPGLACERFANVDSPAIAMDRRIARPLGGGTDEN